MYDYRRAIVRVTRACNLNCPDCALKVAPGSQGTTWRQWCHICGRMETMGLYLDMLTFTGGEPTLWPHLSLAVRDAHTVAKKVRVCTNAMKHGLTMADFGPVDLVQISDYGALNRYNAYRLKREGPVKVAHVVHVPTDIVPRDDALPANCPCISIWFCGDKVYPCSAACLKDVNGCSVDDDFMAHLRSFDPRMQDLCKSCFLNRRLRAGKLLPMVFEWSLWESRIGGTFSLNLRLEWLRKLYRWWLWGRTK